MKESEFIEEGSEDWQGLEEALAKKSQKRHKLKLGERFVHIADDLSYAQSYYNRRSVRVYLNALALEVFRILFRFRRKEKGTFARFWLSDVPGIMWSGRKAMLLSLTVFVLSMVIGAFSLEQNADFAREILGGGYMSMTEENIESGDPMAVYKSQSSFSMFLQIMTNNLMVMSYAFILGLFFGVGTLAILVSNGIMLGVFQYYFYKQGLLWASFLTIWQHGTVEISCIVLGGGAGLMLGSGYLFPGSYGRLMSLRLQFFRGMKVLLAIAPFVVFAAWVEGYITRHDSLPDYMRLMFIIVNALVVIGYFVWLPYYRRHMVQRKSAQPEEYQVPVAPPIDKREILSVGDVFQLSVEVLRQSVSRWFPILITSILLIASYGYWMQPELVLDLFGWQPFFRGFIPVDLLITIQLSLSNIGHSIQIFNWQNDLVIAGIVILTLILFSGIMTRYETGHRAKPRLTHWIFFGIGLTIATIPMSLGPWYHLLYWPIIAPILILGLFESAGSDESYTRALFRAAGRYFRFPLRFVGWTLVVALVMLLLSGLFQSVLMYVLVDLLNTFLAFDQLGEPLILSTIFMTINLFCYGIVLMFFAGGLYYHLTSVREISEAYYLREKIRQIKPRQNRYGIDEEV